MTIYQTTLRYALAIVGSERDLAARLGVSVLILQSWLDGIQSIPDRAFFKAIDLIVSASRQDIARVRDRLQRGPKLPS